jgi:hypothetical protein
MTWHVEPDGFPNEMWTIRNERGEARSVHAAPGFYRTHSRSKADRDCGRLNARCGRCGSKATVELSTDERFCRPCALNIVKDRALMAAWQQSGVSFQQAYGVAMQAAADFIRRTA